MTFINLKNKYIFISNIINNNFLSFSEEHIYLNLKTFKDINIYLNNNKLDINNFYVFTFIKDPIQLIYNNFVNDLKNDYHLKINGTIYGNNIQSLYSYIKYNHCRNIFSLKDYYYENESLPNNMHIFKIEDIQIILNMLSSKFKFKNKIIKNNLNNKVININFEIDLNLKKLIKNKYPIFWSYYNNN